MFEIGDQVIWKRVNYDKSAVQSKRQNIKTIVTEAFRATVIEIREKQYLLEFEHNHIRKLILKRFARLEKITE